jgi:poly-gamma-glutamate synthesis protein (capsule biosynthesis protein)
MPARRYAILAGLAWTPLCLCGSFTLAQETPANRERTLLFVGDVMLARGVQSTMKARGDWTYPFQKVARTLSAADLTFGNLECPISDMGRDLRHLYSFRADPRAIEGLTSAGFRVMSVANNHIDDWDRPALLDTLRRLREAGIQPVGAGRNDVEAHSPVVLDLAGVKLAFLAYVNIEPRDATAEADQPGVAWLDPERALADICSSRSLADLVIVSLHWGVEYSTRPRPRQVKLAHQMVEAGADLVVGHHGHVVQPVEKYHDGWIAYSLGNFIFDQRDPATHHGIILKVTLRGKQIAGVVPIPITIERGFRAVISEEPAAQTSPAAPK